MAARRGRTTVVSPTVRRARAEPKTAHHKRRAEFGRLSAALARKLRALRKERGWTVDRAAQSFGIEPMSVWRLERGDANLTLATLVSVAAAFEMQLHELLAELG